MLRIWRANKRRQELGGDAHLYAAPFRKRCLTGASLTCLQLKDDKKDGSQILKQEIKTIPGNNLVFIRPSNPSILINSQWVLEQHKSWGVWQYICCSVTHAFPVWRQMESTCSSVWHNDWLHQKHLIPHPLLIFFPLRLPSMLITFPTIIQCQ